MCKKGYISSDSCVFNNVTSCVQCPAGYTSVDSVNRDAQGGDYCVPCYGSAPCSMNFSWVVDIMKRSLLVSSPSPGNMNRQCLRSSSRLCHLSLPVFMPVCMYAGNVSITFHHLPTDRNTIQYNTIQCNDWSLALSYYLS